MKEVMWAFGDREGMTLLIIPDLSRASEMTGYQMSVAPLWGVCVSLSTCLGISR